MTKQVPSWLPDWRDPTQYPDPTDTSPQELAWEYLRRNEKFQQKFQEFTLLLEELISDNTDLHDLIKSDKASGYENPIDYLTTNEVGQNFLGITPEVSDFCQPIQRQFMIYAPGLIPDPAQPYKDAKPQFITTRARVCVPKTGLLLPIKGGLFEEQGDILFTQKDLQRLENNEEQVYRIAKKPTELVFSIDLVFSHLEQLKQIREVIQRERKNLQDTFGIGKRISKKEEHDPDLLIIFDADLHGVRHELIIKHLFPKRWKDGKQNQEGYSRVSKMLKRAKALVNYEYIRLAATN